MNPADRAGLDKALMGKNLNFNFKNQDMIGLLFSSLSLNYPYLSVCLSLSLSRSVCLSVCLSLGLCLSVCLSVSVSIICIRLSVCLSLAVKSTCSSVSIQYSPRKCPYGIVKHRFS